MTHRVEISAKENFDDPHAAGVARQIGELGIVGVERVRHSRLFFLYGELYRSAAEKVASQLLADPVVEEFVIEDMGEAHAGKNNHGRDDHPAAIEVHLKPGVMDPVATSAEQAIADMGIEISSVRTARRYEISFETSRAHTGASPGEREHVPSVRAGNNHQDKQTRILETIARKLLANPVIEDIYFEAHTPPEVHGHQYELKVVEVPIRDLDDAALEKLSAEGEMFLNLNEMRAIRDYYRTLGREPRDVELETIAQTWSEHCVHKTFRSDVKVRDTAGEVVEEIPNLLKNTIFASTRRLDKPWCISVFEDNAGVIEFDDDWAVCFKVETHNHPSAIEPYGGASTGIGGVIRDPLGTGLGAAPVANTDVFCFGPPNMPAGDVPRGVLHPRRVMRGVVAGVRDYGNRMGIPTLNGAVYFDEKYLGNPLVYCGTVGILPRDKCFKHPRSGDVIIVVGGRTGRDGIHGATFSSGELTHSHETEFSHAVQIGNPITEKKMLDTLIQARDQGLYSAITDCGAGGLSSAVGEMGAQIGAEVHLERVPLKYAGLSYWEIWISEAQERMVLAVPPRNVERILEVFAAEGVEATVIGRYVPDEDGRKTLRLFYEGTVVGELDMEFLHEGIPRPAKEAVYPPAGAPSSAPTPRENYNDALLKILAAPNVASKEWIIRQYDHEVQGGSVIKPLVGAGEDGPGDAAVIRPVLSSQKALVISCGMNPRLGELDAYQSALHAVDEALRNCVCVGGDLERTALLDNFCWGNCNRPELMGALVQAAKACRDAALAYSVPFISGKDSLNNEFRKEDGSVISIPPTLLVSAVSVVENADRCITADAKQPGDYLFVLGRTRAELGGSHYLDAEGLASGHNVPPVDLATNLRVMRALQSAIHAGCVRACHDASEGGLAVAAAEMAFAGGLSVELDISAAPQQGDPPTAAMLFGESPGRFLVEIAPEDFDNFLRLVKDCPVGQVGRITDQGRITISTSPRQTLIDVESERAKAAWKKTFDW